VSAGRSSLLIATLLPCAIDYFDNALFAFFASYIAGGISATPDELVWASSAYALGAVLGILHEHAWVERLGYRRYLALCMFAFALGGMGAALCDSSTQLMLARAVQGYFVGPMLGACRILIQNHVPAARRAPVLKTFMVMIVFAGALARWRPSSAACSLPTSTGAGCLPAPCPPPC
jgi:MFS family permease